MSITDELREWAEQRKGLHLFDMQLKAIADRIDAEHEKACDDAWNNGYEADYLGIEKWLTEHPQAMELHGWVRLPKDADGEYINVGDDMESVNAPHMHGPVEYIALTESGWEVDGEPPKNLRHHATDTWERIIEDAREYILNIGGSYLWKNKSDELVARCKALAGGENS